MYAPTFHRVTQVQEQLRFMRAHPFAILVTQSDAGPLATHLPFLVEERGAVMVLLAHMAKANPQWRDFARGADALVIFSGPHAYVSPSWYENPLSVPTWNYAAVHASGRARLIAEREGKLEALTRLIAEHDPQYLQKFDALPPEFVEAKLAGIVAFSIEVARVEARFKLSQERTPAERAGVAAALAGSGEAAAAAIAALMKGRGSGERE